MAKDPRTHVLTPQEYLRNVEAGTMPPMNNHNVLKEMAEKAAANDQICFGTSNARAHPKCQDHKNASVALQTDSCDTLYVTENTLVAYTIAVVQNSQTFQYEQMHVQQVSS